ncbi:MAG: universal stress protein [Thermodesulfobacteriaceae bacterium]|nr:universal stress protein [Thermodesulfobacteriaceae bacterium]MDW8135267.1 universal stress protein [Thermodesulfobacterium sp.]
MVIEKILYPTKFREFSLNCLEELLVLKKVGLKEIILCYIIPREEIGFVPFGGFLKEEEEKQREKALLNFENWQRILSERDIKSKIVIKVGNPVVEIIRIAEEEKANLIVVGRKKRTRLSLGSNTLEIIKKSSIPILVYKYAVQFKWQEEILTKVNRDIFNHPLLALDWAESSLRALEFLKNLKSIIEKLSLCYVIDENKIKTWKKEEIKNYEEKLLEKFNSLKNELAPQLGEIRYFLGLGKPAEEILNIARQINATSLIVGKSNKSEIEKIFLGSTSQEIVLTSELPVLVII